MREVTHRFPSVHTRNERILWIRAPRPGPGACNLLVFLDGELCRERLGAAAILDGLEAACGLAETLVVYVSHHSEAARWIECPCHLPFARMINDELLPWLELRYPRIRSGRERVLAGLSYTGLAAAYIALQSPGRFTKVIAQSGSFWSDDCRLIREFDRLKPRLPTDFYLEVGRRETQENVRHMEDVLQGVSQVEGVSRFRDILLQLGHRVHYHEFDGGHEFTAWQATLPDALRWALQPLAR